MDEIKCLVPGCDEPKYATGYCSAHYARKRRGIALDKPMRGSRHRRPCSIEGCAYIHYARQLCRRHYKLAATSGALLLQKVDPSSYSQCDFPGCERLTRTRGLCSSHSYLRNRLEISTELLSKLFTDPQCSICERKPTELNHSLRVDHDHSHHPERPEHGCDSCIRGLLCHGCNVGLGNFLDKPDLLQKASNYLESWANALQSRP